MGDLRRDSRGVKGRNKKQLRFAHRQFADRFDRMAEDGIAQPRNILRE